MSTSPADSRRARIAWRCRRGMRELDLLLEQFLSSGFEQLGSDELGRLESLLEQPDQDILAWLVGHDRPQDPALRSIIDTMRGAIQPSDTRSHES